MRPSRETTRKSTVGYFVSTQTAGRRPFFRHERWARLLQATLLHYAEKDFLLHAYVIMPDHLHMLLTPFETLEKAVQLIKGGFSFHSKRELAWKGEIWQRGFTDHRIRDEEDWDHHLEYIRRNPIEARLVEDSVLYEYMGFPNRAFPQGLKPRPLGAVDVRAEARTLQPEGGTLLPAAASRAPQGLKPQSVEPANVRAEARALQVPTEQNTPSMNTRKPAFSPPTTPTKENLKGTAFRPYIESPSKAGALAPEGGKR